ncbi:MAG TPA: alpha-amylase family protein [Gemmatimonadaceae bacterium]|nr:alpha-amylase family protein [Gemmatimonadaceae bacterium]
MIPDLWYKNTVVYSLDVETFLDSDGDGIGDFEGLMRRLDYLESLGIGAVWLAPFYPSPDADDGYDVTDYYGVDPRFGSGGAFVEFMHQAEGRGIRVIVDLVVNHTSSQHRWFQAARRNPDSLYRDWYIWSEKRPKDWNSGMVFPGVQRSTWSKDEVAGLWYYHRFYDFQPDLNFDNPAVREEVRRIVGYWIQQGVAGFRVDAVPFFIESTIPGAGQGELHYEYLYELQRFMRWRRGDAILLGEANVTPKETLPYFGPSADGLQLMFNFWVNQHLFYALASADVAPLAGALKATRRIPPMAQWAHFLRNHDELDLGRLTEEQRAQVYARFGPDPEMQLYDRGIRRRLAPMLGNRRQLELAYNVLFSLPGTPVLRYGDEIGMGDDLSLPERAAVRTPMQWTDEPNGGFSAAERTVYPVIAEGVYGAWRVNVEAQRRDPTSLLNWMTRLIRVRKECPEIGWGDWTLLATGCPQVLAIRYDYRGNSLIVLHNFDEHAHEVRIQPRIANDGRLVDVFEMEESIADAKGRHRIALDAYASRWYRVGGGNYAFQRAT